MPPKENKSVDIVLRKFKMQWVGDNKIIVLIGPRTRGKSTILLDYLFYNQDIPFCTCIAPTENLNTTYTPHIPSRFIFTAYTPELLATFLKRQMELRGKKQAAITGYGDRMYANVDCRGVLIMDDCLADNSNWKKDPSLRWIFMNGRHADTTFILTMQYQVGIPPELRVNIDWVFLCRENKKIEKEKLHKYYAGIFPSYDMFNQIFSRCTKNKNCMVINSLAESERIEDQVFWFHAEIHDAFRICYDDFWANNEQYLKKRLQLNDPTSQTFNTAKKEEDDYYKYVGGRNKMRYNLNMSEGAEDEDEDEGSGGAASYQESVSTGHGHRPSAQTQAQRRAPARPRAQQPKNGQQQYQQQLQRQNYSESVYGESAYPPTWNRY
jgi:hypothetical protein